MIKGANGNQVFERHKWSSPDGVIQEWVGDIVWKCLEGPIPSAGVFSAKTIPIEGLETCRQSLLSNGVEGLALLAYGEELQGFLGTSFRATVEKNIARTELYLQEAHWLLGPKLGAQVILTGDFAARQLYKDVAPKAFNPRFIRCLDIWTPTLATREEVIALLLEAGFERDSSQADLYAFRKVTDGLQHGIKLHSKLWEPGKNWSLDVERDVWDRTIQYSASFPMKLETTDLFLVCCRRFAIDSLCGSAVMLLDLVKVLEQSSDNIDWSRLRSIKNMVAKPDWFWAAMIALRAFELKTGRSLEFPDWVREGLREPNSFFSDFVNARLNWANPDARIVEFSRAWVKLAKGT